MNECMVWQVLASDCSQQDLGEQASGVVQAVLQGRNSVVLAMGQPASGTSHTLLGNGPSDAQPQSSSPGKRGDTVRLHIARLAS